MSKTKGFFVIKYSTGDYFCGNLSFDKQLRKAKIYVWKEKAIEYAEELKTRFKLDGSPYAPSNEYKIVDVEIREVEN